MKWNARYVKRTARAKQVAFLKQLNHFSLCVCVFTCVLLLCVRTLVHIQCLPFWECCGVWKCCLCDCTLRLCVKLEHLGVFCGFFFQSLTNRPSVKLDKWLKRWARKVIFSPPHTPSIFLHPPALLSNWPSGPNFAQKKMQTSVCPSFTPQCQQVI